jgi:hypothetical protein
MGMREIDARWRQLNPVFVRGMQRSGTSAMGRALREMGMVGFGEGHLWFDLIKPFTRLRDPAYWPNLRDDSYTCGGRRVAELEKYIAVALDRFHRDHLSAKAKRWIDKSPGAEPVRVAPLLAELFPCAQFVFLYRNGITNVHSGFKYWPDDPEIFNIMCRGWVETMSAWREVRESLDGRYIEIAQEEMAQKPYETARRLTSFLNARESLDRVAELLAFKRVLSAFPDKQPGEYRYVIDWSPEQKDYFVEMCQEEMRIWGFEVNLDAPASDGYEVSSFKEKDGTNAIRDPRDFRIAELEHECLMLRKHLTQIEQGRVMRFLKWVREWQSRIRTE